MKKQPKILVVGSINVDRIMTMDTFPSEGQTIMGDEITSAPGGKGANQAVQMAKLGASVTMVGKVGSDENGRFMLEKCMEAGLDINHVIVDKNASTGCAMILLQKKNNQNAIIVYPGANMAITADDIAFLKETIASYDMVVLQLEIPMEINLLVAEYAHEKGVPVFLNTAPYAPLPKEIMPYLSYVCPNETEAEGMTGIAIPREGRSADITVAKRAAEKITACGARNVLITLGEAGAMLFDGENVHYSPSVDGVKAVDPTAAGDSFIGGFCYAITSGMDACKALRFANHTAAVTVSRMGAIPSLPTLEEVEKLLNK